MSGETTILMLGIGGMGMSALAKFYLDSDVEVLGYDRVRSRNTNSLEALGAHISYEDDPEIYKSKWPAIDLCVYTPAIPQSSAFFQYVASRNIRTIKRADALAEILQGQKVFAVAGTHGKTTTASILSSIFLKAKQKFTSFLGGWANDFGGNFYSSGTDFFVVEADEYDRSFLKLDPSMAILTSMDADHLDIYGSKAEMEAGFNEFIHKIELGGSLFSTLNLASIAKPGVNFNLLGKGGAYWLTNIMMKQGSYHFDLCGPDLEISGLRSGLHGRHNLENALAAAALAHQYGIAKENIEKGISEFSGIYRRFNVLINSDKINLVDDYAHHPTEIMAVYNACREMFEGSKLVAVFQPHLFSRTRDFLTEFASALSLFDKVCLLQIYPAREKPIPGVSSNALLELIDNSEKEVLEKNEFLNAFEVDDKSTVVMMGAGDIDSLVLPLKSKLLEKCSG